MTYTRLAYDIEVFSEQDVTKVGLDLHSSDPSCEIIMCSYSYDDEPVKLWTIEDGPFPQHLKNAIADPRITKTCFNAQYERVVCRRSLKIKAPIRSFKCTMALAYMQSFTGGLADVGAQVGLPIEKQKLDGGKKLINLFCKPQKVTKNQPHIRATAKTHPEEWKQFGEYCVGDTIAEKAIARRLNKFPVLQEEWEMYWLDQSINDRGFVIDRDFIRNAAAMVVRRKAELKIEMAGLTGLANPNSGPQLLPWLKERGYPFDDLRANTVKKVLAEYKVAKENGEPRIMTALAIKVLKRRQISSRMSVAKYAALDRILPDDNICRYAFQYGGASRTLRWAGRRFQPHNLPRPPKYFEGNEDLIELGLDSYEHLKNCVEAIRRNDYEFLQLYVVEPMDVLVGALRCAIVPPEDHSLAVSDLSSIETRVTAAVSGCARLLRVIKEGLDPYKDFGSKMFGVPYDQVDKRMRQDSKPAVLGCTYRLGGGELKEGKRTGLWGYAESMGVNLTQVFANKAVEVFRETYFEIPLAWYALENAVEWCLKTRQDQVPTFRTPDGRKIRMPVRIEYRKPYLLIWLPSGRPLYYHLPRIHTEVRYSKRTTEEYPDGVPYTKTVFSYMGKMPNSRKWVRVFTHGGKIFENIVQAIARDVLRDGLLRAKKLGFRICMHVHDEIVAWIKKGDNFYTAALLQDCMSEECKWFPELPLGADGAEFDFYRK